MATLRFYCADQVPNRGLSRGITSYTLALMSELARAGEFALEAVVSKDSIAPRDTEHIALPFSTSHVPGRLLADHLHPLFVGGDPPSLWHYPKGFLPSRRPDQPTIGTIADTIIQFYADHYPRERKNRWELAYWLEMLKRSISRFDAILTVSAFSERSIQEFCHRHKLAMPPVFVTYQGVTRTRSVSEPRIAKSDYVVHLASRYPHKGTDWLLRRWECLQDRSKDTPELRLVGEISTAGTEIVARLRRVSRQPHLGRTELDVLIAGARALLLPSEVEGFGLPALEAYYLGTAVAYVLGTAVEEILGPGTPGGFSFEDGSFDAALDAVLRLSPDAIRQKADELDTRFRWERCVELTSAAYRRLLRS